MKDWKKQFDEKFNGHTLEGLDAVDALEGFKAFISQVEADAYERGRNSIESLDQCNHAMNNVYRDGNEFKCEDCNEVIGRVKSEPKPVQYCSLCGIKET